MPFQVPQYIDVEDKVIGPLSFRQFVYLAGGGGAAFLAYRFMPLYAAFFVIIPVVGLALALSFYHINNRPFLTMVDYATRHLLKPKLYIWHHRERLKKKLGAGDAVEQASTLPSLSESKLKDLSWSLDVAPPPPSATPQGVASNNPFGGLVTPTLPPEPPHGENAMPVPKPFHPSAHAQAVKDRRREGLHFESTPPKVGSDPTQMM